MTRLDAFTRLAVIAVGGLALAAAAAPAPNIRVGVVDTKLIAAESKAIRGIITDSATKAQELRTQLQKKKLELSDRMEAYSAQGSVVTDDEKTRRQKALQDLRDEVEVLDFRLNREIRRSQDSVAGPMGEEIISAIKQVSTEQGLLLVITTQDAVHYDPSLDITAKVIKKLDAKQP